MLGSKGLALTKELSQNTTDFLSPYNQYLVDAVIQEIHQCNAENEASLSENDPNEHTMNAVHVRHAAMVYNQRCLLAYHHERLLALRKFRWQYGRELPRMILANLSDEEKNWFKKYCANLTVFMGRLREGRGLDLTLRLKPPKRLCIRVRCLEGIGEHELEDGTSIVLEKGCTYFLPRSSCEKLIQRGVLQQVAD